MKDPQRSSEDIRKYFKVAPPDLGDGLSPMELSDATQDTTQSSPMNMPHETDEIVDISALDAGHLTPETLITARHSPLNQAAAIEDDIVLEPEAVVPHIDGAYRRPGSTNSMAINEWRHMPTSGNNRIHRGDNIYVAYNYHAPSRSRYRDIGFDFKMEASCGNKQQLPAFETAYESREVYTSRKRPAVSLRNRSAGQYALAWLIDA